jgi:hypothetical protein
MHGGSRPIRKLKIMKMKNLQAFACLASQPKFKFADLCWLKVESNVSASTADSGSCAVRGLGAQPLLLVLFVFAVIAVEPEDARLAFERQNMRCDAIEERWESIINPGLAAGAQTET